MKIKQIIVKGLFDMEINMKDLITIILNSMEVVIPLKDAVDYLTKEILDLDIQKNFIENSITLVNEISKSHSNIKSQKDDLIKAIEEASTDIGTCFENWIDVVNSDFFESIIILVDNKYLFESNELKAIIDYIIFIKYDDFDTFDKLFRVLTSRGHILPMETFGIGMYILERHGNIRYDPEKHQEYLYSKVDDVQHEFTVCTVCGSQGVPHMTGYSLKMNNFKKPHLPFKLFMKCPKCDNCYSRYISSLNFTQESKISLFNPVNRSNVFVTGKSFDKLHYISTVLKDINKINSKKEFLNIGIGIGEFLSTGLELGYEVDAVERLEPLAQNISNLLEIPIYGGDITKFDIIKKYPVIILNNVLERVNSPKAVLEKIYELLDNDGVLWLSAFNYKSAFSRLTKEKCDIWINHLNITLFSKDGLELLLDNCGFKVIEYTLSPINYGYMELMIQKK